MKKSLGYDKELILFIILIFIIVFLNNRTISQEIKVTSEHPFLVDGNWIPSKELSVGDELNTLSGDEVVITKITKMAPLDSVEVYNLEAGVYHNFVVEDDLIVHNSNSPEARADIQQKVDLEVSRIAEKFKDFDITDSEVKDFADLCDGIKSQEDFARLPQEDQEALTNFIENKILEGAEYVEIDPGTLTAIQPGDPKTGVYRVTPGENTPLGKYAQTLENYGQGTELVVNIFEPTGATLSSPYNQARSVHINPERLLTRERFVQLAKHELVHIETRIRLNNPTPSLDDLSRNSRISPTAHKLEGYDGYTADELNSYWRDLVDSVGNLPRTQEAWNALDDKTKCYWIKNVLHDAKDLGNVAENLNFHASRSNEVYKSVVEQGRGTLTAQESVVKIDIDATKSITIRVEELTRGKTILVEVKYNSGTMRFYSDYYAIEDLEAALTSGDRFEIKTIAIDILQTDIKPQIKHLIDQSSHSETAAKALEKTFGGKRTKDKVGSMTCDIRRFVADTQLVTGQKGEINLDPYQFFTPEVEKILIDNNLNQKINGCCPETIPISKAKQP
ncbi:MAG: polymorphic toxin-type HINT domain-containing protein [Candidatus Nanoarchaeia archaeon]|nr:polymorphic toxin-type HINT domain-containing protein [Candidatus Nanoarchaeia archaeon]